MNYTEKKRYQKELRDWLKFRYWNAPYALTLTMKASIRDDDDRRHKLSRVEAEKNLSDFLRRLNEELFRAAYKSRRGKKRRQVAVFSIIEGGSRKVFTHALLGPAVRR